MQSRESWATAAGYIAEEAVRRGWHVIGITDSAGRLPNPHGYELRPMPWSPGGEHALDGVDVLVNTYWVRFSYNGRNHAAFSHTEAVEHTLHLFSAAKAAGVQRIVHTSITHPDAASPLPYFRGKAQLEQAPEENATPHSILRPAILFGGTPAESILINNMAWSLRHLPCVATFGFGGNYRLQPIHVRDYAELAMDEAENSEAHRIVNAVGVRKLTPSAICGRCSQTESAHIAQFCRFPTGWGSSPHACLAPHWGTSC